jgi:hypothetical protein
VNGMKVLQDIPFELTEEHVLRALKMGRKNPSLEKTVSTLLDDARRVARPKALYKVSYVDERDGNTVVIDGVRFESGILRKNLEGAERVFPYVATAGRELDTLPVPADDYMCIFCLDAIKELILESAYHFLERHILDTYSPGTMAHMNPGSLSDWPVSQQPVLFSLFPDVEELVGVTLTQSFLMNPIKSVSGIYFPTAVDFKSCMLCTRHPCSNRRAAYDPEVVKKYR